MPNKHNQLQQEASNNDNKKNASLPPSSLARI